MKIEELKLVLETVASVTDDAKTVAIWWFIANYGASFLLSLGGMVLAYAVVRMIIKAITGTNEWANYGRTIAKAWGGEGDVYSYNRDRKYLDAALKAAALREQK